MPSVLITGANRGLGLEFARSYARDGWSVHACCRQPERAKALKELDGDVEIHRLDVNEGLSVAGLARGLGQTPIDVLINNAGLFGPRKGRLGNIVYDDWLQVFETNVMAPLRVSEKLVDLVSASERKLIVNISSKMGSITATSGGNQYIYRSSKAALNMVTKNLSIDLKERNISVIAVHPGWVRTDMGGPDADLSPEESVAGLRKIIDSAGPEQSGRFFSYNGEELPW
ncbi:MAG: SDR family oxidoreductase [Rhodovibrionaceae bacterium]|nr:SDR family oxidoreductase [Rhodovibrionaceae bacterium]